MFKKKILGIVSACVLSLSLLAGCGNPVTDELTNFINKNAVPAKNALEEAVGATVTEDIASDEDIKKAIQDIALPKLDEAKKLAEDASLETDEVKALQSELIDVISAYKEAYTLMSDAVENQDLEKLNSASDLLTSTTDKFKEYDDHVRKVASENNVTVN